MDQTAWLAHFADRGVVAMNVERERIARKLIEGDGSREAKVVAQCVVLVPAHRALDGDAPNAAAHVDRAGAASGWRTRIVRSLAVDPRKGLIEAVTVRLARHDERLWAAWWNGRFSSAQYWRSGRAIERLGWRTVVQRRGVLDAIEGIQLTRQEA